ncbi:unnamed protein product [Malus baccata var. baccata]
MDFSQGCKDKKKKTIDQSMLLCCKLFISESRNLAVLHAIESAARLDPKSVIINKFEDRAYNGVIPLQQTVMKMAEAASGATNLEQHSVARPRLGVVEDIVFHPFARASMDEAAWLAKAVAVDIGNRFQEPVYLYAAAHVTGKAPDTIRREIGYYKPNFMGSQWVGWPMPDVLQEKNLNDRARPWVALYNIPVLSTDVAATQLVARTVNARGGGLPTVQTLGLVHGEDSTKIACMLLVPNPVGVDRVTDHSPDMIIEKYMKLISSAEQ